MSFSDFRAPPFGDLLVIARQQHIGDGAALEVARPCVMRIFEQPGREALLGERALIAGDALDQPHAGIDQHLRGKLATRQHVIADRDLLDVARFDHALVDALEAAAQQDRARALRERAHAALR